MAALCSGDLSGSPQRESSEEFLAKLPEQWCVGEVRPTHRDRQSSLRLWRTRKDPFEEVWPEILLWLQRDPDSTAKSLMEQLHRDYPGRFPEGNFGTCSVVSESGVASWQSHSFISARTDTRLATKQSSLERAGLRTDVIRRQNDSGQIFSKGRAERKEQDGGRMPPSCVVRFCGEATRWGILIVVDHPAQGSVVPASM